MNLIELDCSIKARVLETRSETHQGHLRVVRDMPGKHFLQMALSTNSSLMAMQCKFYCTTAKYKGFSFRDRLESAVCEETKDLHKTLICVTVNDLLIFPPPSGRPCVAEIQNRLTIMDIVRVAISMQPKCGPSLPLLPWTLYFIGSNQQ